MSGVVTDAEEIGRNNLVPQIPGWSRAFLLEEFNRILISRITLPHFRRGIEVFVEKPDLLPFEEAKLYGHNATHALIGYLANRKGFQFMSEVSGERKLMALARDAFLRESGEALIARHKGLDPLFTVEGYRAYAEDLLERMTNPYLRDAVARVIRDPRRKMGWEDRLVGTMRVALDAGIEPQRFAVGAAAALAVLMSSLPAWVRMLCWKPCGPGQLIQGAESQNSRDDPRRTVRRNLRSGRLERDERDRPLHNRSGGGVVFSRCRPCRGGRESPLLHSRRRGGVAAGHARLQVLAILLPS